MIIAFLTSITLLPALLMVLNPPGEPHPMGFAALAPVDGFIQRYRIPVVVTTLLVVVLAAPLLLFLPFDFNPLHLRNPKVESVKTFLELGKDPQTGANAIEIIAPSLDAADTIAKQLASLPQVAQTETLTRLIPTDQDEKLKLIQAAAEEIEPSLNPGEVAPPPTDQQNIEALTSTAGNVVGSRRECKRTGSRGGAASLRAIATAGKVGDCRSQGSREGGGRAVTGLVRSAAARARPSARHGGHHPGRSQKGLGDPGRAGADRGSA